MRGRAVLVSCEHGGNRVPSAYRKLFASGAAKAALAGHRGHDIGALELARHIARRLDIEILALTTTRLLIDPNRSLGHRRLFSEFSAVLGAEERRALLERHYLPHRQRIVAVIERYRGRTVHHLAVHSFAPTLGGIRRNADIGLLYDPDRVRERELCKRWVEALAALDPKLRVRRNYPYRGKSDGLTTALRRRFSPARYVGIEIEINQALLTGARETRRRLGATLLASLERLLA